MIGEYLKEDSELELVLLDGYTIRLSFGVQPVERIANGIEALGRAVMAGAGTTNNCRLDAPMK